MVSYQKLVKSFSYALNGVIHAYTYNQNLLIHTLIAVIVLIVSFILNVSRVEQVILMVMILLVIVAEMINTSIEEMTDLITTEHRQEAKIAKDVGAGMVLVASIGAALVGVYILFPYFWSY